MKQLRLLQVLCGMALALFALRPFEAPAQEPSEPFAFRAGDLDVGLSASESPLDLSTPQATLELFRHAVEERDYTKAARALNLSRIPEEGRAARAGRLARQLGYVLDSTLSVDWSDVPDRPDGALDDPREPGAPEPRRSITLGDVDASGGGIPIALQRFLPPEGPAVWLFSPQTVAEIETMYAAQGPGLLVELLPEDLQAWAAEAGALWSWAAVAAVAVASAILGLVLARLVLLVVRRTRNRWLRWSVEDIGGILSITLALLIFNSLTTWLVNPSGAIVARVDGFTSVALYIAAVWLVVKLLWKLGEALSDHYDGRLADADSVRAKRVRTQIGVGRRLIIGIAIIAGIGLVLMQSDIFDALGLSLLASAGAMTVVLSIAARPLLENMMAGMQIVATEPLRIGDTVLFQGYWGTIESVGFTYVTIHTWDLRRVVVPHSHLLTHPFENWSKDDESRIMTVHLRVDHRMDVEALRKRYLEIAESDERWHGEAGAPRLDVYDVTDEAMDVRALACGRNSSDAWDLHCHLREELIRFLQEHEGGRYLVRSRTVLERSPGEGLRLDVAGSEGRDTDRKVARRPNGEGGQGTEPGSPAPEAL